MKGKTISLLLVLAVLFSLVAIVAPAAIAQTCTGSITGSPSGPPGEGVSITATGLTNTATVSFYFEGQKLDTVPVAPEVEGGSVTFSVTVPEATYGNHTIKVTDGALCAEGKLFVEPTVKITSPTSKKGPIGSSVTVEGQGFNAGVGATVYMGTLMLAAVPIVDGMGSFTVTGTVPAGLQTGPQTVSAVDKAVAAADTDVYANNDEFTVTPSLSVSPTSGLAGSMATLSGTGWTDAVDISVTFTGGYINTIEGWNIDGGSFSVAYQIPEMATPGLSQIMAQQGTASATASFTVLTRALSLTPSSGPRGTKLTLTGSAMTPNGKILTCIAIGEGVYSGLWFGVVDPGNCWNKGNITISTSGAVAATTLYVPGNATYGANTVTAIDDGGRIATAVFTVTKPTLSIEPATGAAGTTVVVTSEGWIAASNVDIYIQYGAELPDDVLTVKAGSDGKFAATIEMPIAAGGTVISIWAADDYNETDAKQFTVAAVTLDVTPASGAAQTTVQLTGTGFLGYSPMNIWLGTYMVPSQPITNAQGDFSFTFAMPGLAPGVSVITVEDMDGTTASTFFTITAAPVGIAQQLSTCSSVMVRVWGYFGGTWQLYDPADPAGSDLATLTAGRGYWVSASAACNLVYQAFSYSLQEGWNLIGWR